MILLKLSIMNVSFVQTNGNEDNTSYIMYRVSFKN